MNCTEAEELLGAYALDALPEGDAAALRAHLETCPEQAAKAGELRVLADSLHVTIEAVAAPPALRARVLDAIAREPQESAVMPKPIAIDSGRIARRPESLGLPVNVRRFPTFAFAAVAAAFIAVVGGLLAWNISLQNRLDDRFDVSRASAIAPLQGASTQSGHGAVVYFSDRKKALVVGDDLPVPAAGKTYQVWALDTSGQPRSIGLMAPDGNGHASMLIDYDTASAGTLAITVEPAGGSPLPTTAAVFTAKT